MHALTLETKLRKARAGLSLKRVECEVVFPKKFLYLDECLLRYESLDVLEKLSGLTESSFHKCIDFKLGIIYDPVASVIFTNTKGLILNETTLTGIRRFTRK